MKEEFEKIGYSWNDEMRPMLGQKFKVKPKIKSKDDNIVALKPKHLDGAAENLYFSQAMVRKAGKSQHCSMLVLQAKFPPQYGADNSEA